MVEQFLENLGKKARDRVTGASGVITSVCFDLYGCVQYALVPQVSKDAKSEGGCWYDEKRLVISTAAPVMDQPAFVQKSEIKGPATKPAFSSLPIR